MRTISATLTAAAKSSSTLPYVRVQALRKVGTLGRLEWERIYTGAEADALIAMVQLASGDIVRIRVSPTATAEIQRITSPSGASAWGTWPAGGGTNVGAVAICASGTSLWAFYSNTTAGAVYASSSTDSGATWSAWSQIESGGGGLQTQMAAAWGAHPTCVYNRTDRFAMVYHNGSSWIREAFWTNTAASVTGVAMVADQGDYYLVITGTALTTLAPTIWTCVLGDGTAYSLGTWGPLSELRSASAGSGVDFSYPALADADVYRLFFQENFSGTTAYNRPYWSHSMPSATYAQSLWREPVPFNLQPSTRGIHLAYKTGTYVYTCTASGVWRAPLITGSALDLTANVVGLVATAGLDPYPAHAGGGGATVRLDNSAATYSSPGAGALLELQRGAVLTIDPGYKTTAGSEVPSSGHPYWIEGFAYVRAAPRGRPGAARAEFVITAIDPFGLLARWRSRQQYSWTAGSKTVYQLIAWILARVGLELTTSGSQSAALTGLTPAFTIHPGDSGLTTLRRLLARVPDRIFFRSSTAYINYPQSADSSVYTFGVDHQIIEGEYSLDSQPANQVQVLGATHFSEDFNWTEITLWGNRMHQIHDINLTTAADCAARAAAEIRALAIDARDDAITVRTHPGAEVLDVVSVTDATAGLTTAKRRVVDVELEYDPAKAVYQQTLTLGDA